MKITQLLLSISLFSLGLIACTSEYRMPLDPTMVLDPAMNGRLNQAARLPLQKDMARKLQLPSNYRQALAAQLAPGLLYQQFIQKTAPGDPAYMLRTLLLHPKALKQLEVLFSDRIHQPLSTEVLLKQTQIQALLNATFFGSFPAGDIIGKRCQEYGKICSAGIFYRSENLSGKDLNQRYSFAINHQGQARFFRGGLHAQAQRQYRLAVGGALLLFDQQYAPALYRAIGSKTYNTLYVQGRYNHPDLVRKGQAGYPFREASRMAIGILSNGGLVLATVGEGRHPRGASPARMAQIMKQLGAVRALMFDGGGASQMAIKNKKNQLIVRSLPLVNKKANYLYNYSFLTLKRP